MTVNKARLRRFSFLAASGRDSRVQSDHAGDRSGDASTRCADRARDAFPCRLGFWSQRHHQHLVLEVADGDVKLARNVWSGHGVSGNAVSRIVR